jgi:transposase-like protein
MRRGEGYSIEFKKAAVEKLLTRGYRTVDQIAKEIGISSPTIYQWKNDFANMGNMKKSSKPQDRSVNDKLKALTEYNALSEENRGEYLRKNGLYEENINEWLKYAEEAFSSYKKTRKERVSKSSDQKKIKDLEKELRRKDKALAEVSALLILKKKANLIWGTEEDE